MEDDWLGVCSDKWGIKGHRGATSSILKKKMDSFRINLLEKTISSLPADWQCSNMIIWEVFRGVEEMVNCGDTDVLESILAEYGGDEEIIEYDDAERRIANVAEYVGKYPYVDVCDFSRDELLNALAEMRELAITEDEWKAQAILAREIY